MSCKISSHILKKVVISGTDQKGFTEKNPAFMEKKCEVVFFFVCIKELCFSVQLNSTVEFHMWEYANNDLQLIFPMMHGFEINLCDIH